jgi:hypothetical protein
VQIESLPGIEVGDRDGQRPGHRSIVSTTSPSSLVKLILATSASRDGASDAAAVGTASANASIAPRTSRRLRVA